MNVLSAMREAIVRESESGTKTLHCINPPLCSQAAEEVRADS